MSKTGDYYLGLYDALDKAKEAIQLAYMYSVWSKEQLKRIKDIEAQLDALRQEIE